MNPLVSFIATLAFIHAVVAFAFAAWGYHVIHKAHPDGRRVSLRLLPVFTWITFSALAVVFIALVLFRVIRIGW